MVQQKPKKHLNKKLRVNEHVLLQIDICIVILPLRASLISFLEHYDKKG